MVQVTEAYLEHLESDSRFLGALHDAGVDNWDGYEFAIKDLDD